MGRRRSVNVHHIKARCLFPPNATREEMDYDNTVELDRDFHDALHEVFGIMPPHLYGRFLRTVLQPNTVWNRKRLEDLRQRLMR